MILNDGKTLYWLDDNIRASEHQKSNWLKKYQITVDNTIPLKIYDNFNDQMGDNLKLWQYTREIVHKKSETKTI